MERRGARQAGVGESEPVVKPIAVINKTFGLVTNRFTKDCIEPSGEVVSFIDRMMMDRGIEDKLKAMLIEEQVNMHNFRPLFLEQIRRE